MKISAWLLVAIHALALTLGLYGILVAIPHPETWASAPGGAQFYAFAINKTGGTGMFLGALAMLVFGLASIGTRRTLLFFAAAFVLSAAAELTGTKTGWPFGGYEYTDFLGYKLLGRVPIAVPLSWFYMGFASFLLADAIVVARGLANRTFCSLALGAYLLTAWDLVLDPSMAAPQMQYAYFGMPLRNLVGWFGTGLVFMAAGRALWRESDPPTAPVLLPFTVYAINIVWSMILAISAGMWPTAVAAIIFSLLPAALALTPSRRTRFA
jgi:putative membrane protein